MVPATAAGSMVLVGLFDKACWSLRRALDGEINMSLYIPPTLASEYEVVSGSSLEAASAG